MIASIAELSGLPEPEIEKLLLTDGDAAADLLSASMADRIEVDRVVSDPFRVQHVYFWPDSVSLRTITVRAGTVEVGDDDDAEVVLRWNSPVHAALVETGALRLSLPLATGHAEIEADEDRITELIVSLRPPHGQDGTARQLYALRGADDRTVREAAARLGADRIILQIARSSAELWTVNEATPVAPGEDTVEFELTDGDITVRAHTTFDGGRWQAFPGDGSTETTFLRCRFTSLLGLVRVTTRELTVVDLYTRGESEAEGRVDFLLALPPSRW